MSIRDELARRIYKFAVRFLPPTFDADRSEFTLPMIDAESKKEAIGILQVFERHTNLRIEGFKEISAITSPTTGKLLRICDDELTATFDSLEVKDEL